MPRHHEDDGAIRVLFALLFAQPFPLGGNRPVVWWLFEAGFLVLAAWIAWSRPGRLARLGASADWLRWLWPALFAWLGLQTLFGWLGPGAGLDPNGLLRETLKGLAWIGAGAAAFFLLRSKDELQHFALLLVALGGIEALFGLLTYNNRSMGIWGGEAQYFHAATGSYPNYNHFAGLLELCLPFGMVTVIRLARAGRLLISFTGLATLVATVMMAIALPMSGSRAGVAAAVVAALLVLPVALRGRATPATKRPGWRLWLLFGVVVAVVLGGLLSSDLLYRFATRGGHSIRPILWGDLLGAVRAHPWLGNGAGTLADLSPLYKSWLLPMRDYRYAHNDYLHWMIESGVPLALLLFAIVGAVIARLTRYVGQRAHHAERRLHALACLWALLAMGLHGLFDFNFHIPANAALFMAILGVGASILFGWRPARRRHPRSA